MTRRQAAALGLSLALVGCAAPLSDGPPDNPPPGLERTPDAVPRIEPIRPGGPNKAYAVAGRTYVPLTGDVAFSETGLASWYGRKFHGRPTSSGEPYDMFAMTAAHKTLPIPSYARVRNPANGREIVVRVNDRGPFVDGRVIDLSYAAAAKLGLLGGVAPVTVRRITFGDMRAGQLLGFAEPLPLQDAARNEVSEEESVATQADFVLGALVADGASAPEVQAARELRQTLAAYAKVSAPR